MAVGKTCHECGDEHPIERAEVKLRPAPGETIWDWLNGSLKEIIDDWNSEGLEIEEITIIVSKKK